MAKAVEINSVYKSFGKDDILKNISMEFEEGKIYGLIGRNGSGKTVLMKCILGFYSPTRGHIKVFGKTIGKDCDFAPNTGMIIENPGFILSETGYNNLKYLRGKKYININKLLRLVGLNPKLKKPVSKYSLGMKQRLGIAQAIMESPKLLILDEPMNGLDNKGVADMRNLLLSLKKQGVCIVLASHNKEDIELLCEKVFEIDHGRIINTYNTLST